MKNTKGFSYIELVVTMLIFITLSLISYPIYTGVAGRDQSKLAEGYSLLGYLVNAEIAYYNQYGNFYGLYGPTYSYYCRLDSAYHLSATSIDPVLGINAINNRYFSTFSFPCSYPGTSNTREYEFTGFVFSKDTGTIRLRFNLTQRFEPEVTGI